MKLIVNNFKDSIQYKKIENSLNREYWCNLNSTNDLLFDFRQ